MFLYVPLLQKYHIFGILHAFDYDPKTNRPKGLYMNTGVAVGYSF